LVKAAKAEHGNKAGEATCHMLDAELDLAEALIDSEGVMTEEVEHARSEFVRPRGCYSAPPPTSRVVRIQCGALAQR